MNRCLLLFAPLPCFTQADEQSLSCYVVGVSDGDTLTYFDPTQRKQVKIRLRGIDAPEAKQHFGQRSKQSLPIARGAAIPSMSAVLSYRLASPGGSGATRTSSRKKSVVITNSRSGKQKPGPLACGRTVYRWRLGSGGRGSSVPPYQASCYLDYLAPVGCDPRACSTFGKARNSDDLRSWASKVQRSSETGYPETSRGSVPEVGFYIPLVACLPGLGRGMFTYM